jgi:hypothetical protein
VDPTTLLTISKDLLRSDFHKRFMVSVYFRGDDLSILMSGSQNMCGDAPNLRNCKSCSSTYPDRSHDRQNSVTGSKSCSSPSLIIAIGHYCQSCVPASRATCFYTCLGSRAVANWVDLTPCPTVLFWEGATRTTGTRTLLRTANWFMSKSFREIQMACYAAMQPCSHAAPTAWGQVPNKMGGGAESLSSCVFLGEWEPTSLRGRPGRIHATLLPAFDVNPLPHVPAPICERRSWRAVRRASRPASCRGLM